MAKSPIVYDGRRRIRTSSRTTNGNGKVDPGEAVSANKYVSWTPRLLCAAYNYQYVPEGPRRLCP